MAIANALALPALLPAAMPPSCTWLRPLMNGKYHNMIDLVISNRKDHCELVRSIGVATAPVVASSAFAQRDESANEIPNV